MNEFWKNLLVYDEKIQQNNIPERSSEALVDALNDNPEEIPDDIEENDDQNTENQDTGAGGDDFGMGGDESGGDFGSDSSGGMDDFGTGDENESLEPEKIQKDKYSLLNGKIELVKRFESLISYAESTKEMLESNLSIHKEKVDELDHLIEMMEDIKSKVPIKTQAESLIRYRMCFVRLKNILNECVKNPNLKPNNND